MGGELEGWRGEGFENYLMHVTFEWDRSIKDTLIKFLFCDSELRNYELILLWPLYTIR